MVVALLQLSGCGNSSGVGQTYVDTVIGADQVLAPDGQGKPCRTGRGRNYNVVIPSPLGNGETIAATVFEPTMMDCDEKYPLVLFQSGWATPRPEALIPLSLDLGATISPLIYELLVPLPEVVAARI